ncbi:hypothetical protein MJO29_001942 [Puccinia striiformis f. sp. tritici]|nr:hypothetical protein MJO29_001942 [Puccinia striiformis f. sp. tritici]
MAAKVITNGKLYDAKADICQPAKLEGTQFSNPVKEFLAACLIDEPNDRPTAEDLCKHKWIKSISKAPLSPLKDLTNQYSRWINLGGV